MIKQCAIARFAWSTRCIVNRFLGANRLSSLKVINKLQFQNLLRLKALVGMLGGRIKFTKDAEGDLSHLCSAYKNY